MEKISRVCGAFILAIVAASCGGSTSPGDNSGGGGGGGGNCPANTFCMTSATFTPPARAVAPGSTVTWTNESGVIHNVTWDDAAGRNAALAGDGTGNIGDYSSGSRNRLFNAPGTYKFHCTIHGTATTGMRGSLTVQ